MRRTRRGPKVVWLPPDITINAQNPSLSSSGIFSFDLDVENGGPVVAEIPLVIDETPEAASATLSDIENSGYRLRRIVGKIFAKFEPAGREGSPPNIILTAGIIIQRLAADGSGSLAMSADSTLADPQEEQNWTDPWIWRRTWFLTSPEQAAPGLNPLPGCSTNYAHGPAMVDGPHIDQKTARIISQEERLFLDFGARTDVHEAQRIANITIVGDIRVLGSLRTNSGNRRNASR